MIDMFDVFMTVLIVSQDLQLEYVHGYRGFDSRNNLHYINDGADIVFHAAGAGIVQNLSTGKKGSTLLFTLNIHVTTNKSTSVFLFLENDVL